MAPSRSAGAGQGYQPCVTLTPLGSPSLRTHPTLPIPGITWYSITVMTSMTEIQTQPQVILAGVSYTGIDKAELMAWFAQMVREGRE